METISNDHDDDHDSVLQSLMKYDQLRRTPNVNITRIQNVDVVKVLREWEPELAATAANIEEEGEGRDQQQEERQEEIALCHVPILSPLSRVRSDGREIEFEDEFEIIAAVMLAMEHFNTGNGVIIPDIEGINQRCNIRFTTELVDTEHSESAAVNQVINIVGRQPTTTGSDENDDNNNTPLPCSFFGTTRSSVCIPTAIITGLKGYPQFSPECTSPQLNSQEQFPLFGRLINSDDGTSLPVLRWLQQKANVDNLVVLYRDDSYGIEYARAIQHTAKEMAAANDNASSSTMNIELVVLPYEGVEETDFDRAIQQIQETDYRFIFAIISRSLHYDTLMTKAYNAGIAGTPRYTWIFSDSLGTKLLSRKFHPVDDKPLVEATRGIGVITPVGGSRWTQIYERYSTALQQLNNPNDLQYIKSKFLPILKDHHAGANDDDGDGSKVDPIELQSHLDRLQLGEGTPQETFSSLGYDTIIAIGQGACAAAAAAANDDGEEDDSNTASSTASSPTYFNGAQHFQAIVDHQFQGISGMIDLDKTTGSRNPESALFNMINFVADDDDENDVNTEDEATIRFKGIVTDVFDNGTWFNLQPYRFNDGSTIAPLDLPSQQMEYNHIGTALRAIGLTLSVVILLASIGFAIWTYVKRKTRVVRASQPIFLTLICAGTLLMGASIIPLSIDDQIASVNGCNIACMSSWWLLGIGFPISLSALVTKTNRIVRIVYVGSFRRVRIGAGDVMVPMVAFIGVNVLILTLWTILSPLRWKRETIATDNFGRPSESYGHCYSEGSLPYAITLCVVNFGGLVAGVTQAYKARHLVSLTGINQEKRQSSSRWWLWFGLPCCSCAPFFSQLVLASIWLHFQSTDFAESEYIAMAMALMLVVGFIAIPVVIIAEENPGAFFFVVTAVVFACSMSLLMLVFLPKMFAVKTVRGGGRRSSISDLRRTLSQPSFRRELTSSVITSESGIACVNPDHLLPRTRRENKDLLNLTTALQNRIRHMEEESSGAAVPESAILMGDNTMRHDSSIQGGINVFDKREELKEVQKENRELRKLRRELEERLSNLEKNQPYEDDA